MVEEHAGSAEDITQQVQQQLQKVLTSKVSGSGVEEYISLIQDLRAYKDLALSSKENADQEISLYSLTLCLTGCVSAISERHHAALITEYLTIPLWDISDELREAVLNLMLHMVVVNSTLTPQTLQVLVLNLNLPLKHRLADVVGQEWQPSELAIAVHEDVLQTLEKILQLVPVSGSLLLPILVRGMPNKVLPRAVQCTYLRALFRIAEFSRAVAIRDNILAAVVQHLVCLDVEIRWQDITFSLDDEEDEEDDDEEEGGQDADVFELEGQTEQLHLDPSKYPDQAQPGKDVERREGDLALERVTGRGGFEGKATANPTSTSGRQEVDEAAEKLDSMMTMVFEHLRTRAASGQLQRTCKALLDTFFTTVLNTHKSKFTQYLVWYLLNQDPEQSSKLFLKRLLAVLGDTRQADISRSAAAAYIASFLARAAFLPETVLLQAVQQLAGWCRQYCLYAEGTPSSPKTPLLNQGVSAQPPALGVVHQVFYAACQGLLYVFCYRLEQLMACKQHAHIPDSVRALFKETIPVLLKSRLEPMAVCLPTVVTEFTRLASRLGLMDCRPFLPDGEEAVRCQRPLEMFFPFDPYLLNRSASYLDLRKTFVRWKQGHSAAAEESEAADDSDSSGIDTSDDENSSVSGASSGQEEEVNQDVPESTPLQIPGITRSLSGKRIRMDAQAAAASLSSNGSPACPMSWTPKLPDSLTRHHKSLRPLGVYE